MLGKLYMILPKESSYDLKSDADKRHLEDSVITWYEYFSSKNVVIRCIAEDFLAIRLLHDKSGIKWISVLGERDKNLLKRQEVKLIDAYWELNKKTTDDSIIKDAIKNHKILGIDKCYDPQEWNQRCLHTMEQRIRCTVDRLLSNANAIVIFDCNNNFCKIPNSQLGDGKIIVTVKDWFTCEFYCYGGVPLSFSEFDQIVRNFCDTENF